MTGLDSFTAFLQKFFVVSLSTSLLKICVLVAVAYLLSRESLFGRLLLHRTSRADKIKVFLFFSALALMEWWINPARFRNPSADLLAQQDTSVNTGLVAAVTAGLLIGPEMGFAIGFLTMLATMASIYVQAPENTPTVMFALNPGLAAVLGGSVGGWIGRFRPTPRQLQASGFMMGALSQAIWLSILLFRETTIIVNPITELVAPWSAAILSGGLGVVLFLWIIGDLQAQQARIGSVQIERAFSIANRTLPWLRQGLTAESAGAIAEIVYSIAEVGALALTDGRRILAHVGAGSDHHPAEGPLPFTFEDNLHTGQEVRLSRGQLACAHPGCPLASGVLSPLVHDGAVMGGVLIYGVQGEATRPDMVRLGVGLAQFFSNYQLELAELERQTQAASQAELKALQSQVHPHFLFNVLNTLAAYCEMDPRAAGKLTVRLAAFLRRSLRDAPEPLIPLREEWENVQSYLEIERARFQDRLHVTERISEAALDALVPSFGLQILVENAALHGISRKSSPGHLFISAEVKAGRLWCVVRDDGPGFTPRRQAEVFAGSVGRASGLVVLRERGRRLMGRRFLLRIIGRKGEGTTVIMALPLSPRVALPGGEAAQHVEVGIEETSVAEVSAV